MDWVPRYTGVAPQDQCKLTCQARALGYYYVLEPRVRVRTPPGPVYGHTPAPCSLCFLMTKIPQSNPVPTAMPAQSRIPLRLICT